MTETERVHGQNWREWNKAIIGQPAHGLEIGTFKGEGAEVLCRGVFTHPDATLTCVDTFEGSVEHHAGGVDCGGLEREWRARMAAYPQARAVKGRSNEVLRTLTGPYDFVYVDAAHDAMSVLRDGVLAFDLLKVGGCMVFDDYFWRVLPDALDCPKIGVDAFLAAYAKQVEVIAVGSQVAVRKVG